MSEKLIGAGQAAKHLNMSRQKFYNEVYKGLIPFHQTPAVNGYPKSNMKFRKSDLDKYIRNNMNVARSA